MSSAKSFSNCHVMVKPSGSVCNLDCSYCFYLEKEKLYPQRHNNWKMDEATLEAFIKQQIAAQDGDLVNIGWQGGEPTLLGIDFYRKAVALCDKYANGKTVQHSFQTNGLLLDQHWCEFFNQHDFLVGVSIDGPAELHDTYRLNGAGKGSHDKVMQGINQLQQHGVAFNTLTVVNNINAFQPKAVYRFLKSIGAKHMQFIPLVERKTATADSNGLYLIHPDQQLESSVTPWSVPSWQYGEFLKQIFDEWLQTDVGQIFIQIFDATFASWCGQASGVCVFSPTCGNAFALEANGDLYCCDHFVYPEYKLGNIHHSDIRTLNVGQRARKFGQDKLTQLNRDCVECEFNFACHGGCPKHRFMLSPQSLPRHNYLCQGYLHFFKHTAPYMTAMRDLLRQHRAPAEIMTLLRQQKQQSASLSVGRNQPCPCGSGNKFKRCCGKS